MTQFVAFLSAIAYAGRRPQDRHVARMLPVWPARAHHAVRRWRSSLREAASSDAGHLRGLTRGVRNHRVLVAQLSSVSFLIPKEHANEYYGFFIFGKHAVARQGIVPGQPLHPAVGQPVVMCCPIAVLFVLGLLCCCGGDA